MTNLQVYRKKSGLTQAEFSRLSKISIRSIQDLEQGRISINNVHLTTLLEFGRVLRVPFVVLLEDEDLVRRVVEQCGAVQG